MENFTIKRRKSIGTLLMQARTEAGVTLEEMAEAEGVSRNTISNWEHGVGVPDIIQLEDWFQALNIDPAVRYLTLRNPSVYKQPEDMTDEEITEALVHYMRNYAAPLTKRELYFHFFGKHGSDPVAVIQKTTAYLQLPLEKRQPIASNIYLSYRIAESMNELNCPDDVKPDLNILGDAVDSGFLAVLNGSRGYSIDKK